MGGASACEQCQSDSYSHLRSTFLRLPAGPFIKALEKKQRAKEDAERKERVREEKERQEAELKRERAKLRGEGGLVGAAAEGNSNGKSPCSRGENIKEHSFPALAGSSSSPPGGVGDQQRPDSAGAKKKKKSANAGAFKYDKKVLDTVVRQLAELLGEPMSQGDQGDDENWEESWFLDRLRQHNLDLAAYVTETAVFFPSELPRVIPKL